MGVGLFKKRVMKKEIRVALLFNVLFGLYF